MNKHLRQTGGRPVRYHEDTLVCQADTVRKWLLCATACCALAYSDLAFAQSPNPTWHKVANFSVEAGLAGRAGGAVSSVWFSPAGSVLFALTPSGKIFQTADLETWSAAPEGTVPAEHAAVSAVRHLPEPGASVRAEGDGRIYALGRDVYASEDGGLSWTNLTGFHNAPVIGADQHDLAVSPADRQLIVVANGSGVWRSNDGGLSWSGLNENLPNLPVTEIVNASAVLAEVRVTASGFGTLAPESAASAWQVISAEPVGEQARARVSAALGTRITALAQSGETAYAGSADGRLWVSTDKRGSWTRTAVQASGSIERIYADPEAPRIAFAAAAGTGQHIFRTINSGLSWDNITGALADAPAHGITADRAGGIAYVATDRGVFMSRMDVNVLGPVSAWTALNRLKATDVKLDAAGSQLFIALDGYGVYATPAPHRAGQVRLLNSADMTQRAAAPGSLYSIVGDRVQSVRAGATTFPVLATSDDGSQIQVPFEITGSQINLTIERQSGPLLVGLTVKPVSPAIFLDRDGAPMLLDGATGLMMEAGSAVQPRARLQVLATGLGRVSPAWPTGMPAPAENPPAVSAGMRAFVNGVPVEVTRATLAPGYVGLYLVEFELPPVMDSGSVELYLVADGQESNRIHLTVGAQ